eukprot:RCo042399
MGPPYPPGCGRGQGNRCRNFVLFPLFLFTGYPLRGCARYHISVCVCARILAVLVTFAFGVLAARSFVTNSQKRTVASPPPSFHRVRMCGPERIWVFFSDAPIRALVLFGLNTSQHQLLRGQACVVLLLRF